jgi:hypothetical protein
MYQAITRAQQDYYNISKEQIPDKKESDIVNLSTQIAG